MRDFAAQISGYYSPFNQNGVATAPDYVEPTEDPQTPPADPPTPPIDTPIDPVTDEPEPGIDPELTELNRIEIVNGQAVVRTTNDPGTYGVAYIASPVAGGEYWEFKVNSSTPKNATFAVGVTTLAMPLNGIPGDRSTELAWWSDGTVKQNGVTLVDLGTAGALKRGDRGAMAYGVDGSVQLFKNCAALNSGESVGTLDVIANVYPFVALYSAKTRIEFVFASGKFGCAIPAGYLPIGVDLFAPSDLTAEEAT